MDSAATRHDLVWCRDCDGMHWKIEAGMQHSFRIIFSGEKLLLTFSKKKENSTEQENK